MIFFFSLAIQSTGTGMKTKSDHQTAGNSDRDPVRKNVVQPTFFKKSEQFLSNY